MKTKFNLGEEVYVKHFGLNEDANIFTVKAITIDEYGIAYFLENKRQGFIKIYEDDLESVIQQ